MLLVEYICLVLNCSAADGRVSGADAELAMARWIETYEANGVRANLPPGEREFALHTIDSLISLSDAAPASIRQDHVQRFMASLDHARADILAGPLP